LQSQQLALGKIANLLDQITALTACKGASRR
jgi:hypothetical protein